MPCLVRCGARFVVYSLLLAGASLTAGCGGGGGSTGPLGKVTGVVTMDGKPLVDAMVSFAPENGKPSSGRTDVAGKYTLSIDEGKEGAVVGKHKVQIIKVPTGPITKETGNPQTAIPARYNFASELTAEVKSGDNTLNFELTSQ